MSALPAGLRATLGAALGLVYPPTCIACGQATAEPHALCPACWSGLRLIERPFCERLGTPFALDLGVGTLLSPRAIAEPPVFQRARAVALYEGTAQDLVHRLKYGDRLDLGRAMARMMASAGAELIAETDLVVPVPLHALRLWRRRFNQAALLARDVASASSLPCDVRALARVKRTRPQVGLTRVQRADNLQGAFRVPEAAKPRLAGRRVLLVDDVATTGATGNAAARALLRGGARQVDLLTFATVSTEAD
ncbi:ComF family protein [Methylobacterium sp. C25]|uniref:ComF family protein n=1 Tax=Methylobacterium sp. C25 TaxID=2721622 RepID=UPI001F28CE9B|nr:ComF family protein [Methylobacterium sp. C25]MCE4225620.1 ComF family protein [Methylobacterium sp. C25]